MKNKLFLFLMMFGMAFFVGCGDSDPVDENPNDVPPPPEPEVEAVMSLAVKGEPGASQATLTLTTEGIKEYAFKAYKQGEEPASMSALLLFSQGQKGDCVDGENTITVNALDANSTYTVYVAGIDTTDEYYKEVISIEVITKPFTDEVTQFDVEMDGYKVHVNINNPDVESGKSVYRWALLDWAQYNYLQGMGKTDVMFMLQNDYVWGNFISENHTFTFDNAWENRYLVDDKGNVIDYENGGLPQYYSISPGAPAYFLLGEYQWGHIDDLHWVRFYNDGDERNYGWYKPCFDMEALWDAQEAGQNPIPLQDNWWTGYHYRQLMEAAPANVHEGTHRIDESTLAPKGGTLTLIPDDRCVAVQFFLGPKSVVVDELKAAIFKNDDALWEKYLPYFSCSESAFDLFSNFTYYTTCNVNGEMQNVELSIENNYWANPGDEYVIIVNGCGPETKEINGQQHPTFENQYFSIIEFTIPESTLPLSTIEVTPVETDDPYSVTFNIKCPSRDAAYVEYLCDYESSWKESGMDNIDNLKQMFATYGSYNRLTGDVLAHINSSKGYDMVISSRPNAVSYLGAVAYNKDKIMGEPASASVRSAKVPLPDPVDQARFEEVAGDWTASATIMYSPANSDEWITITKTSPVTIGDLTLSETTPDEVYAAYGRKPKDEVDALYAEFYNKVMGLNEEHRSYNRIICQGFDFQVPAEGIESYLRYADPYYLYVAPSSVYNGSDDEQILWEFGPKWYIEFQPDGTAYAPFDVENFAPLTAWTPENYDYYLIAANIQTGRYANKLPEGIKGFPVEISEDKNTITVKGFEFTYVDSATGNNATTMLYPQPAFVQTGAYNSFAWVISDVVLTRNNTTAAAQARLNAPVKGEKAKMTTIDRNGGKFVAPAKMQKKFSSRTPLTSVEQRGTIRIENVRMMSTVEELHESASACIERKYGVKLR